MKKTEIDVAKVLEIITVIYGVEQTEQFIKALMEDPRHYKDWICVNFDEWNEFHLEDWACLTAEDQNRFCSRVLKHLTEKYGLGHSFNFLKKMVIDEQFYLNWFDEYVHELYNEPIHTDEADEDDY